MINHPVPTNYLLKQRGERVCPFLGVVISAGWVCYMDLSSGNRGGGDGDGVLMGSGSNSGSVDGWMDGRASFSSVETGEGGLAVSHNTLGRPWLDRTDM